MAASSPASQPGSGGEPSESTPLLINTDQTQARDERDADDGRIVNGKATTSTSQSTSGAISDDDRPLPKLQILILCLVRVGEPISFFSIFPFINQMVAINGSLPPSSVGFYSGLIESLFSLTQMIVMVFWGRASDRFGRKPVLIFSLTGMAVAVASFGFAKTIWQMIVLRCLAGVFAGTAVTVRTMVGEQSTIRTQARAYSWYGVAGNLGIFLGPLMGGALAEPARQYGGWWQETAFFVKYPFALPTLVVGVFTLLCTMIAALFVEETLRGKTKGERVNVHENGNTDGETVDKPPQPSLWQLLKTPGVPMVLFLYGYLSLIAFAFTAVMPVYWYTPRSQGGFGFSELQISIMLAALGAAQAVWLLGVFPPLQRRVGTRGVMRWCGFAYPFFAASVPASGLLLWYGGHDTEVAFWIVGPLLLSIGVGISMSFTASLLCVNLISPSSESLGTLNSLALALQSGIRAFTPFAFSSMYAVSVKKQILHGQFVWLLLGILAALFGLGTLWLPKKTDDREKNPRSGEGDD